MKTVYWSPFFPMDEYPSVQLMYEQPDPLLQDLLPRRNKNANGDNWFQCHAFQATIRNTFILRNHFSATFAIDDQIDIIPIDLNAKRNSNFLARKQPSVINAQTFATRGLWLFWSEEPLIITTTPAHYHKPVFDGYYIGGSFDIGKWFRPIEGAIQLNEGVNTVSLNRGDPLAYVKFETKEPITLKRFYMTKELEELNWGCINYKRYEPKKSLNFLYDKFTQRGLDKIITREIKKNLVG
jgi:hypothetical protein